MIVKCNHCGIWYDDTYRWTFCPHDTFLANNGNNQFSHNKSSYRDIKSPDMKRTKD